MDITVGKALSYLFGLSFLLSGAGSMMESVPAGLVLIATGAFLLPPVREKIDAEYDMHFSRWVVVIVAVVGLGIFGALMPSGSISSSGTQAEPLAKNATLTIDRIETQAANLYPTRVTIQNTGEAAVSPKFDMTVFDSSGNQVCAGSPMFNPFSTISPGAQQTEELNIGTCTMEKDGTYRLQINMFDADFNQRDSAEKTFEVSYWGQFS